MRFMSFRASNLALLAAIVVVLAGAMTAGVVIKNRTAENVLDDVASNATVLTTALATVEAGEAYVQLGQPIFLRAFEEQNARLDVALVELERVNAGEDADRLIGEQVIAARRLQAEFRSAIERRAESGRPGGLPAQGERFQIFDEVVALNSESSSEFGHESLDRAERRFDPVIGLSILALGALILALGFAARRDDRSRRRTHRFSEALQAARSQGEAYKLVGAHLERSVPGSKVAVFNRNNSSDRLEASTPMDDRGKLAHALEGAAPEDCLAIRTAKTSTGGTGEDDLLRCDICGKTGDRSLCVPSIVGGEVIGSVLVQRPRRFDDNAERVVADGVSEAAPVVAHLRNLAVAERRAASDKLTGLPNKRTAGDVLRHMVAQSARSQSGLALALFDLDHFKRINDTYGHPKGDEVLAAIGATVKGTIREHDFAARDGGEEFMVVLPDTGLDGAMKAAENMREAIASLRVPGLDQDVTASFGVACFPDDAGEREGLVRAADRALYEAKRGGRNRVVSAASMTETEGPDRTGWPESTELGSGRGGTGAPTATARRRVRH
jgi:diguanylate cyclase (GGDEF)-like protein